MNIELWLFHFTLHCWNVSPKRKVSVVCAGMRLFEKFTLLNQLFQYGIFPFSYSFHTLNDFEGTKQ